MFDVIIQVTINPGHLQIFNTPNILVLTKKMDLRFVGGASDFSTRAVSASHKCKCIFTVEGFGSTMESFF